MFSSKALTPIIGQETTTSRFEHALQQYRQQKEQENKPKIVWVNGKAQLAEVGFDSIDEFVK